MEKTLETGKKSFGGQQVRILDLCTGSGAIAVSIACFWPEATITGVDISGDALEVAKRNAGRRQVHIDFRLGDLFEPVRGEKFDMIVSNPPYVSEEDYTQCSPEVKREPTLALLGGSDGLEFYRRIAREADDYLNPKGLLLMEIGYSQGGAVRQIFAKNGYQTALFRDYAGLDRIVLAEKE